MPRRSGRKNLRANLPRVPLNIKDPETDALVRRLAALTGESITGAIRTAVRERLERVGGSARAEHLRAELDEIADRCSSLPVLDARDADDLVGYGPSGAPL